MTYTERQAVFSLSAIMALRMLALFMVLPVFSVYAAHLAGATPILVGTALGIYGLTQALFQIPFGMISDYMGRKKIIFAGLLLFFIGSFFALITHSIWGMIIARATQGAGAIGSTIIAAISDLTAVTERSKAMAIVGMTIGTSFTLSFMLGPMIIPYLQVNGIFGLAALLSLIAMLVLLFLVPRVPSIHNISRPTAREFVQLLIHKNLYPFYLGIFLLHAIITANFVVLPLSLQQKTLLLIDKQWILYLPALLIAFVFTIPFIIVAEKKQRFRLFFLFSIILLGVSQIIFFTFSPHLIMMFFSLLLFFIAFSVLEAFLPSLISRTAPPLRKGTALGIYSCAQFLGIFVGGLGGGWLYGTFSLGSVYLFCSAIILIWLMLTKNIQNPNITH